MTLRALIADDEPPARFRIRELLGDLPDVQVIAEASTGCETLQAIRAQRPDLLFLDVQMPGPTGTALLQELPPGGRPCTIFVTGHDLHAVEAFELGAIDYLLKPFSGQRFQQAVARARDFIARKTHHRVPLRRLMVRNGKSATVVPVDQIIHIESADNYVVVHAVSGRHILRRTLASFEAELEGFTRINRAALVNLDYIQAIESTHEDEHHVLLKNNVRLPLSRGVRELHTCLERNAGQH